MISTTDGGGRIARLKERIVHNRAFSRKICDQRRQLAQQACSGMAGAPQVVLLAEGLAAFLRGKDMVMFDDDLFAGYQQGYDYWVPPSQAGPRSKQEAADVAAFETGQRIGLYTSFLGGHVIAGYDRVLQLGLGGLSADARRLADKSDAPARDFANACLTVLTAAGDYALRYAAEAEKIAARTGDAATGARMQRIADACRHVAADPPRSFFEAVQLFWLTHEIITAEQPSGSLSCGRVDQLLQPYYACDLAAGKITRDQAAELILALWIKFNGLSPAFQNVTLGGLGPDGRYAANDLSYMCLRASRILKMDQPLISVRWHQSMPEEFWEEVMALLEMGLGFPALFNDEVAIEAKRRQGIAAADAANYGIVGCVELSIPGKDFSHTEVVRISWAKVLELMLHGGVCPLSGVSMPLTSAPKAGELKTFEQFYAWYKRELAGFVDLSARAMNVLDREYPSRCPYPFLSATMEGPLACGRDVTAGGTVYNMTTINGTGMADAVDSLSAVRKLVYDDRRMTLAELAGALRGNFAGAEGVLAELRHGLRHYGNDLDEPDSLMADLTEHFCDWVESHRNPRGGGFQVGLYSVFWHAVVGELTGALPWGRAARKSLANGLSPCQGADAAGPTAVVRSITKLDHRRLGNGMVLDMKFHPSFFRDADRREAFRNLLATYFALGGMEAQFNVVSRQTLLAAQQDPDAHRDLLVRVSGYSEYFVNLSKVCQDEIIARTEYDGL